MSKKKHKYYLNVHKGLKGRVVSICDEELINKKLESNSLNLVISEKFYKGELVDEEIVLNYLKNEKNLNIVGKNVIELCIKNNIIDKEQVMSIGNIPISYIISM